MLNKLANTMTMLLRRLFLETFAAASRRLQKNVENFERNHSSGEHTHTLTHLYTHPQRMRDERQKRLRNSNVSKHQMLSREKFVLIFVLFFAIRLLCSHRASECIRAFSFIICCWLSLPKRKYTNTTYYIEHLPFYRVIISHLFSGAI